MLDFQAQEEFCRIASNVQSYFMVVVEYCLISYFCALIWKSPE